MSTNCYYCFCLFICLFLPHLLQAACGADSAPLMATAAPDVTSTDRAAGRRASSPLPRAGMTPAATPAAAAAAAGGDEATVKRKRRWRKKTTRRCRRCGAP